MFTPTFQIVYLTATLSLFSLVVYLSGATIRRIAGAVFSALVFTALSAPIDTFALHQGWWSYPTCHNPPHPPLPIYIGQAFMFVGCLALIAWRVQRSFGLRGVAILTTVVCLIGTIRDFTVSAIFPAMIRFGPLPASALADMGAWAIVMLVAIVGSRLISGPSS